MCWFYMGIAQVALDPPASVKRTNVEKSAPNHPGKPLTPTGNAYVETTHVKKGLT